MPLVHITADGEQARLHGRGSCLQAALKDGLNAPGPVIIMVHGFKFSPHQTQHNPHRHILSLYPETDCWKALSWPRALGFGSGFACEGLGLPFGWHARGSIWEAYREAERAGHALADLVRNIRQMAPDRPIHLIGHSLGARVILSALAPLPAHAVNRIILLNPAEYGHAAHTALNTPAGRTAELFNITSRENDLFDFIFERLMPRTKTNDCSLSNARLNQRNALTIEIDHHATLVGLRDQGFALPAPDTRICHWSAYLRPGVFSFYRALLRTPRQTPIDHLRARLPDRPTPRWSRILGLSDLEEMRFQWTQKAVSPRPSLLHWRVP